MSLHWARGYRHRGAEGRPPPGLAPPSPPSSQALPYRWPVACPRSCDRRDEERDLADGLCSPRWRRPATSKTVNE
ncbi:hypothetical protein E2562_035594 [Oryza meyeriana var. granulata]|uniref:Uncharacterized protein n=1 Tax=Oryza meyeriana var. granulata TaxID=110450 RepID=A0A6G1ESQ8_9ORYZ|nr:hypothetical protein E2562_035594 [Oryza meyeriana var. granulata]